ncbi:hypothetical protein SADUNF_Sadunf07G0119700 [Salix dunnii]|uniref:O-acyltransferase WSD1 C-terminal domain-containing protein n=1 Tax=Salix dunnii TaxID=1413687 RepID=A0A835K224_9ROSI|nr:hypothetical protein SADUNF_Sadunf07G0119700 [Salix dunnii]
METLSPGSVSANSSSMVLLNTRVFGGYKSIEEMESQILMVGVISYAGKFRVALLVEKDFIDPRKLKSHIEHAFDLIFKAACSSRTSPLAS